MSNIDENELFSEEEEILGSNSGLVDSHPTCTQAPPSPILLSSSPPAPMEVSSLISSSRKRTALSETPVRRVLFPTPSAPKTRRSGPLWTEAGPELDLAVKRIFEKYCISLEPAGFCGGRTHPHYQPPVHFMAPMDSFYGHPGIALGARGPSPSRPVFDPQPGPSYLPQPGPSYLLQPGPSYLPEPGPSYHPQPGPSYLPEPGPSYHPHYGPYRQQDPSRNQGSSTATEPAESRPSSAPESRLLRNQGPSSAIEPGSPTLGRRRTILYDGKELTIIFKQ